MKRNLKALGLALMAAFAMSAFAAGAAQAEGEGQFTQPNNEYPVAITGHEEPETENYFQITGSEGPKTECNSVTYEATLAEASDKLTVTPHYTECVSTPSGLNVNVDLNGCDYVFEANTTTSATDTHGSVEIACPPEQQIEVTVGPNLCVVDIPPQTIPGGGVTFTNISGAPDTVTVDVNIDEKITYTETDTSIFCPNTNNVHLSNGSFVSSVLVKGYEDLGTHHWITKEEHQGAVVGEFTKETLTEGAQIGIDVG